MKNSSQRFASLITLALAAVVVALTAPVSAQNNPVDWTVGDVFVGTGSGNYQVWHSANPGAKSPVYTMLQTINDGTAFGGAADGGATAGCAFDLGYRFFGTNSTQAVADRYAIDNGDNNRSIVQQLAGTPSSLTTSVAFDSAKSLFVGYAGGASGGSGTIEQWTKDTNQAHSPGTFGLYTFAQTFSVPVDSTGGPGWIDLAADGHTIFYTAQGRKIYQFDSSQPVSSTNPVVYADLSKLNAGGSSGVLYAIKVLGPNYDGTNGVLVADGVNIKQVVASAGVITSYQIFKFSHEANLQALALDAFSPLTTFWAGDASSNDLIQFNMSTGKTIVTLNTGTGTTLGGVCTDGGFSGAELHGRNVTTQAIPVTPATNTISATSAFTGAVFTATLPNLQNNTTLTLRDSLVDPSVAISDPTVWSFNPGNPALPLGTTTVPGNMICDQTLTTQAGFPNTCEVFELEANPNVGLNGGTTVEVNGPANAPVTPNARLLRNLDEDITDDVDATGTRTTGKCVYTVNQQATNQALEICGGGFSSPASGATFNKNQTSTISFKFKVSPTGSCPNGQTTTLLQPLLMIVQIQPTPKKGPTPAPVNIPVLIAGNSGGPPVFVLSGNSWQLQVKTNDMPAGFTYVASMVDLTGNLPAMYVTFTIN